MCNCICLRCTPWPLHQGLRRQNKIGSHCQKHFVRTMTRVCISEHFLLCHCPSLQKTSYPCTLDMPPILWCWISMEPFPSYTAQSYPNARVSHLDRDLVHGWTSPCSRWHASPQPGYPEKPQLHPKLEHMTSHSSSPLQQ